MSLSCQWPLTTGQWLLTTDHWSVAGKVVMSLVGHYPASCHCHVSSHWPLVSDYWPVVTGQWRVSGEAGGRGGDVVGWPLCGVMSLTIDVIPASVYLERWYASNERQCCFSLFSRDLLTEIQSSIYCSVCLHRWVEFSQRQPLATITTVVCLSLADTLHSSAQLCIHHFYALPLTTALSRYVLNYCIKFMKYKVITSVYKSPS